MLVQAEWGGKNIFLKENTKHPHRGATNAFTICYFYTVKLQSGRFRPLWLEPSPGGGSWRADDAVEGFDQRHSSPPARFPVRPQPGRGQTQEGHGPSQWARRHSPPHPAARSSFLTDASSGRSSAGRRAVSAAALRRDPSARIQRRSNSWRNRFVLFKKRGASAGWVTSRWYPRLEFYL